jgi:hypothetical protein
MKSYRVTLKYCVGSDTRVVSSVILAFNSEQAIDKVTDANNLVGQVTASKAVEIN